MSDEKSPAPSSPEHLLGDLEAAIMQVVWARGEVTVRAVRDALAPTRALAYTTVMTVMSRLAQKGILVTRKQGKTYYYRAAAPTPDAFMSQRAEQAVNKVLAIYGDVAIAQFLRAMHDVDPARLAAVQVLLNQEMHNEQ